MKWISAKIKPKKDGLYLCLTSSADRKKPFKYLAWYTPKRKKWELYMKDILRHMAYWCEIKLPKEYR